MSVFLFNTPKQVPADSDGPKAWVGCLHCYNSGDLVGAWFEAAEAADVTLMDIHAPEMTTESCEELWCFDVDGLPVNEEMEPLTAAQWGNLINNIEYKLQPAFYAWVEANAAPLDEDGLPDPQAFEEAFVDVFTDFREYADRLADETLLIDASDELRRYFDYEAFARDLSMDYVVEGLPDGDVAIFHA